MEAFGLGEMALAVEASALALNYLYETQKTALDHINRITPYSSGKFMVLDATTLRNLEVLSNIRDGTSKNTLLDVLDKTRTPMGSRLLRKWLLQPLMNTKKINERLDAVEIMVNRTAMRHDLGDLLRSIGDPERLIGKVVYGNANPKELVALKNTLKLVPKIRELVKESIDASKGGALGSIGNDLVDMGTTVKFLEESISEEPPRNLKDGGVIREGFNTELDLLRTSSTEKMDRRAGKDRKEEYRNKIAQGRLQPGLRILHRGHEVPPVKGARPLPEKADPSQCGKVRHP
jgi:DNA mismatch repair protein MutS